MTASRTVLCFVSALTALGSPLSATAEGLSSTNRLSLTRDSSADTARTPLGLQLRYVDSVRPATAGDTPAQAMNLSFVGKARLGPSLGVFGKLGTTYGRPDTTIPRGNHVMGAEQNAGLSFGAGMSYAFTPRLSATVEWDSNDYRFAGASREPVRSTSLGLQYRY